MSPARLDKFYTWATIAVLCAIGLMAILAVMVRN